VSGLGLLVASFLPWYSAGGDDATAWQAFSVVDLFIAAAALAGLSVGVVVLFRLSVSYPVAGSAVTTLFGGLALLLVAYRLIDPPGSGLDLEVGAWLGLLFAAGVTLGGYLGMQERSGARLPSAG
jgi:Ni/Fe-hydrogenase subunit HybB-like protein